MAEGPRGDSITTGTTWIQQVQPGPRQIATIMLAGTACERADPGCAGLKHRDGKHNPTPHLRSPPLQPVYLGSRLGSRG